MQAKGHGPPEMASCGLDGCVRVWDVRQQDQPVASFEPLKGSQVCQLPTYVCALSCLNGNACSSPATVDALLELNAGIFHLDITANMSVNPNC